MANPPGVIGPFANVPAPGSAIRSDWPIEITNDVVALLDRQPKYWNATGQAGTSGGSFGSIQSQVVPAQTVAGILFCWSFLRIDMGTMAGDYVMDLKDGATAFVTRRIMAATEASRVLHIAMAGARLIPAATSPTINLGGTGTANVTTYGNLAVNRLDIMWIATPFTAT